MFGVAGAIVPGLQLITGESPGASTRWYVIFPIVYVAAILGIYALVLGKKRKTDAKKDLSVD